MEDVADAQARGPFELADAVQHLGQPGARHDAVLHVVVRRHPAHRGERRLPALPDPRALRRRSCATSMVVAPLLPADLLDHRRTARAPRRRARRARRSARCRPAGKSGCTAASAARIASAVHHLDRRRNDARADDVRDRGAAARRSCRTPPAASARASGLRRIRTVTLVTIRQRALRADQQAEQIRARRVRAARCRCCTSSPSGSTASDAEHVVHGEPVLQAVRAAGVLGDVAADRAHLLARRIGRVVVAERRDLPGDLEVGDAGLDRDPPVRDVDVEHAVEARQRDHDAAVDRQRAARQAGAMPARHERHAFASRTAGRSPAPPPPTDGSTTAPATARRCGSASHS